MPIGRTSEKSILLQVCSADSSVFGWKVFVTIFAFFVIPFTVVLVPLAMTGRFKKEETVIFIVLIAIAYLYNSFISCYTIYKARRFARIVRVIDGCNLEIELCYSRKKKVLYSVSQVLLVRKRKYGKYSFPHEKLVISTKNEGKFTLYKLSGSDEERKIPAICSDAGISFESVQHLYPDLFEIIFYPSTWVEVCISFLSSISLIIVPILVF